MSERRWGFSAEEWSARRTLLERLLVETAAARSTVTYGEVARRVFDGRVSARSSAIMVMLGEVDDAAYADDGIMIASLVVRADTGMPGEGYFIFAAEQLGLPALDDRREFWEREAVAGVGRVCAGRGTRRRSGEPSEPRTDSVA